MACNNSRWKNANQTKDWGIKKEIEITFFNFEHGGVIHVLLKILCSLCVEHQNTKPPKDHYLFFLDVDEKSTIPNLSPPLVRRHPSTAPKTISATKKIMKYTVKKSNLLPKKFIVMLKVLIFGTTCLCLTSFIIYWRLQHTTHLG